MSSTFYPPLPPELVAFAESGLSMLVGTRDADLVPHAMRAVGVRVWPGASQLTVFLPAATGGQAAANARATGQLALTLSRPATRDDPAATRPRSPTGTRRSCRSSATRSR